MNTTPETAPDPGYYVPTPADCLEAGMIQPDERGIFFWVAHTLPALEQDKPDIRVYLKYGDRIAFYPIESNMPPVPYFECAVDQSMNMNHELVFANRDACMAFLRNHIVTAAEPASDPVASPTPAYTPTQDDCRQARMYETKEPSLGVQFKWRYPNSMKFIDRSIIFPNDGSGPYLVHKEPTTLLVYSAPQKVRDLAFPDKDACAAFLRDYPFLAAEEGEEA